MPDRLNGTQIQRVDVTIADKTLIGGSSSIVDDLEAKIEHPDNLDIRELDFVAEFDVEATILNVVDVNRNVTTARIEVTYIPVVSLTGRETIEFPASAELSDIDIETTEP